MYSIEHISAVKTENAITSAQDSSNNQLRVIWSEKTELFMRLLARVFFLWGGGAPLEKLPLFPYTVESLQ